MVRVERWLGLNDGKGSNVRFITTLIRVRVMARARDRVRARFALLCGFLKYRGLIHVPPSWHKILDMLHWMLLSLPQ